jgi:hypothetical protein
VTIWGCGGGETLSGRLQFPDGSSVDTGGLNGHGCAHTVSFSSRTTTFVKFQVIGSGNIHTTWFKEIEAYQTAPYEDGDSCTRTPTSNVYSAAATFSNLLEDSSVEDPAVDGGRALPSGAHIQNPAGWDRNYYYGGVANTGPFWDRSLGHTGTLSLSIPGPMYRPPDCGGHANDAGPHGACQMWTTNHFFIGISKPHRLRYWAMAPPGVEVVAGFFASPDAEVPWRSDIGFFETR